MLLNHSKRRPRSERIFLPLQNFISPKQIGRNLKGLVAKREAGARLGKVAA